MCALLHTHALPLPYNKSGNDGQSGDKTIKRCQKDGENAPEMDVPQVSLKLIFRGREQPSLQSIRFISGPDVYTAEAPQDRDLAKAVAIVLVALSQLQHLPGNDVVPHPGCQADQFHRHDP